MKHTDNINGKIYLGLDIGTNSCGWAVTDEHYNIQKVGGKDAWGVRVFERAETQASRRAHRSNRRRKMRKKLQNVWLRELFDDEIARVDEKFFTRLQYSNLWKEDKKVMGDLDGKYSLFDDVLHTVYNDKDYYQKYKTVYHLRQDLLTQPADDVRLLYLAIHSFLTHRGHFLNKMSFDDADGEDVLLVTAQSLFAKISQHSENNEFALKCENLDFVDHLLDYLESLKSLRDIKEKLAQDLDAKTKLEKEIVSVLVSGKSKTNKIFDRIEKEDTIDFDFNSSKYEDETYGKLLTQLDEEEILIIDYLKNIFSNIQLKRLLGNDGDTYICQAMVKKYQTHAEQLNRFKQFIKKYYPSKMRLFFRHFIHIGEKSGETKKENIACNYAKYINSDLENGKKYYFDKTAKQEDFFKFVADQLQTLPIEVSYDEQEYENEKQYFIDLIDKNAFLPKIRSHDNAVIPNSLYIKELKKILDVNSQKYDFLNKTDDTGLSVSDKIISIVEFRVPYFVGPIGTYPGVPRENGWAEKECDLEFRPWTLDKIVNFDKAEDTFIQRMTNKCTYLHEEEVLPNHSLLYSKFRVLNELNNLKINGNAISVQLKQIIFDKLFKFG